MPSKSTSAKLMKQEPKRLEKIIGGIVLVLLLLGCLLVLRPFVSALLWAVVLSFSAWPVYRRVLTLVRGRRTVAALLMTLAATLILLVPFLLVGFTLADSVKDLTAATRKWMEAGLPDAPTWLAKIPVVGQTATEHWQGLAGDSKKLLKELQQFIQPASAWLLSGGLKLTGGLVQLAMSILIAFFFYRDGSGLAERLKNGVDRIAGERGQRLLELAGNTVRSVVYGILGTALVQGVMAGIGFLIAGVPGAALLALLTFFLSIVPMGPPLVWIPAAIWLFQQGHTGWGIFMLVWGVGVSSVDNFVKPWLISQGSNMPFILIMFGVLGGALAFGFIGVFLGPTLLAVGYRLIQEWITISRPVTQNPSAPVEQS
jgi:predicted PurR-regulated permease PerM